jgi:hypothetical protein
MMPFRVVPTDPPSICVVLPLEGDPIVSIVASTLDDEHRIRAYAAGTAVAARVAEAFQHAA